MRLPINLLGSPCQGETMGGHVYAFLTPHICYLKTIPKKTPTHKYSFPLKLIPINNINLDKLYDSSTIPVKLKKGLRSMCCWSHHIQINVV